LPPKKLPQRLRKSVLKLRQPRRLESLLRKPRLKPRDLRKRPKQQEL